MKQTAKEWIEEKEREELARAIEYFGNAHQMGLFLDISQTTVAGWTERGRISATGAAKLEELLPDVFSASEMRPDVKMWYHRTRGQGAK